MKALVLAGGNGVRLRPITHTWAKQLVPVANKPVLFYGLEALAEAGVREVGLVVGHNAAQIEDAVGDGTRFELTVTYLHQEAPLGLAHAVLIARDFLGDDDFVMYLGDNFIVGGIRQLVDRFHAEQPAALIMLTRVSDPRQFGVAEMDASGRVVGLEEKPERPRSEFALVGVYMFGSAIHDIVAGLKPSKRGELEITDAIQEMINAGLAVASTIITGYWKDTGNVQDMLEVNRLILERLQPVQNGRVDRSEIVGRVEVCAGAQIKDSRVVGPAMIGRGAVVCDSYVGPFTSVGDGCRIFGSEIENSIMLPDASVDGVRRIEGSLIGRSVRVSGAQVRSTHRLVLGDHSWVQVSP